MQHNGQRIQGLFSQLGWQSTALAIVFVLCMAASSHANHLLRSTTQCTKADNLEPHTVEVIYARPDQPAPCRVFHTKSGIRSLVGSGNNTPPGEKSCESIERNITNNLRIGGYDCTAELAAITQAADHTIVSFTGRTPADHGRYAVQLDAFQSEDDAQIFVAAVKRALPFVAVHLRRARDSYTPYIVYLGGEPTEEAAASLAETAAAFAAPVNGTAPTIVDLFALDGTGSPLRMVTPDWQRYAVTSCYRQGNDTQRAMAKCSGLLLESRQLTACLNGGLCKPPQVNISSTQSASKALSYVPERALVERRWPLDQIGACTSATDEASYIQCGIEAMLTEDQRKMLSCGSEKASQSETLACIAGSRLGPSDRKMLACLENEPGDDESLAKDGPLSRCVFNTYTNEDTRMIAACYDNRAATPFAACIADSISSVDDKRVTACAAQHRDDPIATGLCVAQFYVTQRQAKAIDCWSRTTSVSGFAVCALGDDLGLTPAQRVAASCAATAQGDAGSYAACAGGTLTLRELKTCSADNIGGEDGCFGQSMAFAAFRQNTMTALARGPAPDNAIVQRRAAFLEQTPKTGASETSVEESQEAAEKVEDAPATVAVEVLVDGAATGQGNRADISGEATGDIAPCTDTSAPGCAPSNNPHPAD